MSLNNYDHIKNTANAFGIEFTHPDDVIHAIDRMDAFNAMDVDNVEPVDLRAELDNAPCDKWPGIVDAYAVRRAKYDAIRAVKAIRFGSMLSAKRAHAIESNVWHYVNQLPLSTTINEFVKAVQDMGDDWENPGLAVENGNGEAASIAARTEAALLTLKNFKANAGVKDNRFIALIVEPPTLPAKTRLRNGAHVTQERADERKAINERHRVASRVRSEALHNLRAIAAGEYNGPDTFVMSAPKDEDDYNRRITEWDKIDTFQGEDHGSPRTNPAAVWF